MARDVWGCAREALHTGHETRSTCQLEPTCSVRHGKAQILFFHFPKGRSSMSSEALACTMDAGWMQEVV